MIRFVFRIVSLALLVGAVAFAVLDATRSIVTGGWSLTPFADDWAEISPETLAAFRAWMPGAWRAGVWMPAVERIFALPGFAVLAGAALLFGIAGYRPEENEPERRKSVAGDWPERRRHPT